MRDDEARDFGEDHRVKEIQRDYNELLADYRRLQDRLRQYESPPEIGAYAGFYVGLPFRWDR